MHNNYFSLFCSDILPIEFLQQYSGKNPKWGYNGLGYIVYKRTYARRLPDGSTEEWWQTVARCINGAQEIGADYTKEEAQELYDYIFNLKCSYAGRMLWLLGTDIVKRFNSNGLLNCWASSIRKIEDFCFLFENLMLGGGVGFSVKKEDIHELPRIYKNVMVTHECTKDADFIVPDSREGWVKLLHKTLYSFFHSGKSFTYSTILIRGAGEPIKGFGGTASGPRILIEGLEKITKIIKNREGKKLRSIDVLDICNIIGSIVVAGNVRRCLPEYSLVHTDKGLIPIKDINVGDKVLTTKGYKRVNNKFKQGKQNTIFIKTQDGYFECTPNHKMAVLNSVDSYDWINASELKSGDRLISPGPSSDEIVNIIPVEVIDVVDGNENVETYDIEVEEVHEFFADGYLTHNSALIALGDPDDYLYLRAKRWDLGGIPNWRAFSNNTIFADSYDQISEDVWTGYNGNGEPYGFFNLPLSQKKGRLKDKKKDNGILVNPCLTGDALILTDKGEVKLSDIVHDPQEYQVVTMDTETNTLSYENLMYRGLTQELANVISIKGKDGTTLKLTPHHLVFVKEKGWIPASDIRKGDKVIKVKK